MKNHEAPTYIGNIEPRFWSSNNCMKRVV